MPEKTGVIGKIHVTDGEPDGFQFKGERDWYNPSIVDYRSTPFEWPQAKEGDEVRIEFTTTDKGKRYFSVLQVIQKGEPEPAASSNSASSRDRSIEKQVALKAAVELALGAWSKGDQGETWENIVGRVVYAFQEFVEGMGE